MEPEFWWAFKGKKPNETKLATFAYCHAKLIPELPA